MQINPLSKIATQPPSVAGKATPAEVAQSFSDYLSNAMGQVNQAQLGAQELTKQYAAGQVDDIHQVMIAGQKASVMLQLTMQVRNKVIESYQEIMRMPL
ncbi:flagellar hook-basal body complex protein FliE [Brevibacillus humidisoli]|uniref:flagellar hook-basal body complex protein FliE n=1 Tax=Brevibacillus humidisoli TaxID=2895522 RepID=UPI001E2CA5EA|nr:flagellar hook-basal body complex protein FliE [Brevibacillus humidisoli]UFJ42123.1 flagellar hook-basal body complex protein FliE [Brevibacillus humidisoli]